MTPFPRSVHRSPTEASWRTALVALIGVMALVLAAGMALMVRPGQGLPRGTAVDAAAVSAGAPGAVLPLTSELAPAARDDAAPAASQAVAAAPGTPSQQPGNAAAPVERWAAQGIDLAVREGDWDAGSLSSIDAALSALPGRLVAELGNPALGPMHIAVNREGRELSGEQPYGGPANFYSTNDGVNELVLYPDQSEFTVLHELGHAYNLRRTPAGRYALVLLDPEMQSFMAATGWQVLSTKGEVQAAVDQTRVRYAFSGGFAWSNLSHDDPLEDFANSFALYFLDPASLQSLSPARYDWFVTNIGR